MLIDAELERIETDLNDGLHPIEEDMRVLITGLRAARAENERLRRRMGYVRSHPRGTLEHPCEECGQTDKGHYVENGFQRCNACGYPGK